MSDLALSRAQQLLQQGRPDAAAEELRRALQSAPQNPQLNYAMGQVLAATGQGEQSLYYLERALASAPDNPTLLVAVGRALGSLNRADQSLAAFTRATQIAPNMIEALEGLAQMLRIKERYTEAAEQARRAVDAHPDDAPMAVLYAGLLTHTARVPEAVAFTESWLDRHAHPAVIGAYAAAMTYHPTASPQEVFEAQVIFGRTLERPAPAPHAIDRSPDRPLRIGLLSYELRRHAVATFLQGWLANHDRAAIQIHCYASAGLEDEVSARIKTQTRAWRNVSNLPDDAIASQIRADRIDILLETSGLTDGQRLGVLALRPAPVQVSLIGYLNTTGVRAIDYRIADVHTEPMGSERYSVEKPFRLDPTYWCYTPPDAPPISDSSADRWALTFGSFNTASKLNDRVIALWSRLLRQLPDARLFLKSFDFADPLLCADLASRFDRAGLSPTRIEFEGPTIGPAFFSRYDRVDIALDPTPFCGTTTTMDALWMGVPVVTLAGDRHAGRTGVSILSALGMPELIAQTEDDYIRIAADLGADAPRRASLRATLRDRVRASPLCDWPGFARRMDAALRTMWRAYCEAPR